MRILDDVLQTNYAFCVVFLSEAFLDVLRLMLHRVGASSCVTLRAGIL